TLRGKFMRICIVTETFPPEINGVAMTLNRIAHGLVAEGHEVLVIRPKQRDDKVSDHKHAFREVCVPGMPIPGYQSLNFGLPSGSKIQTVWKTWQPQVVYIATEGPLGFSAIRAAERLNIPTTSGFHTNFNQYMADYNLPFLKDVAGGYLKWFHNRTLATFAPSPDTIRELEALGLLNLRLLGRGVDTQLFSPDRRSAELRASWGASPDTPVAIYVSRMAAEKNLPLAIEAMTHLKQRDPRTKCVFVGDGPERENMIRRYPDFIFAGMRRDEDLATHYASADLFIFPSTSETFGNVVTEALASGLVTIAFDYAAPKLYIRNGENGHVVPFADEAEFVNTCHYALSQRDNWEHWRTAARETSLGLSWKHIIEGFVENLTEASKRFQAQGIPEETAQLTH
ncbi:MAG: glycosyltransferase family 1 protein, partial [Verrucomicrobiota bacterium]